MGNWKQLLIVFGLIRLNASYGKMLFILIYLFYCILFVDLQAEYWSMLTNAQKTLKSTNKTSLYLQKKYKREKEADRWTDGRTTSNSGGQTESIRKVCFDWGYFLKEINHSFKKIC